MSSGEIAIRPARVEDAERIVALSDQLGYPATLEEVQRRLARIRQDQGHAIYVAVLDGHVAGWIHVCVRPLVQVDLVAEIEGLVVDESRRHCGIGRCLIQQVEQWALEQGCGAVYVRANVVRKGAHAFYEGAGYECCKTSLTFRKILRE